VLTAFGVLLFLLNLVVSVGRRRAGPDPWGSGTLEWAADSPPARPALAVTPVVVTRYPLWEQERLGDAGPGPIGTSGGSATPRWRQADPRRARCRSSPPPAWRAA